jgi:putative cardiolipin synthase
MANTALEIARLPDLTAELLAVVEKALLLARDQEGLVSVHALAAEMQDRYPRSRLEALFFALSRAGALMRIRRDRHGHCFDLYQVEPVRLRQTVHDASVARSVLDEMRAAHEQTDRVELIATLPESLCLGSEEQHGVPSLCAGLHRLITQTEQEILILSPFFEQVGFDRFASALLAAARRGVVTTVITHQLGTPGSINHRVLSALAREAAIQKLNDCFTFWEYQHDEKSRIVPAAHAKVLVSDSRSAYVGSANLTEHGMAQFLELGVLLHGPLVTQLTMMLRAILASKEARRVVF